MSEAGDRLTSLLNNFADKEAGSRYLLELLTKLSRLEKENAELKKKLEQELALNDGKAKIRPAGA